MLVLPKPDVSKRRTKYLSGTICLGTNGWKLKFRKFWGLRTFLVKLLMGKVVKRHLNQIKHCVIPDQEQSEEFIPMSLDIASQTHC